MSYEFGHQPDRRTAIISGIIGGMGIALAFCAERYGIARYEDSNDLLEAMGGLAGIAGAAVFISNITPRQ
jgi:hypothetical protein